MRLIYFVIVKWNITYSLTLRAENQSTEGLRSLKQNLLNKNIKHIVRNVRLQ